jgi:DNA-binding SARP family transcriptional activator/TolB-like protein/Tfp pilus assembly protein PilF
VAYLRLLGGACIVEDGDVLSGRAAQKHRLAILALLAAATGRALTRERVIGLVWPDKDEERGRHLLSVALYEIRKELGEDVLSSRSDEIVLDPELLPADIDDFEAAFEAGDTHRAIALYEGPFLDGFVLRGCPDLEQWIDSTREYYAGLHRRALERLARSRGAEGDALGAVDAWRELASLDPLNGRVALGLLRALNAAGNRAGALRFALEYEERLREELDAEPDAEFLRVAASLKDPGSATGGRPVSGVSPAAPAPAARGDRPAVVRSRPRPAWGARWTRRVLHSPRWRAALLVATAVGLAAGILATFAWDRILGADDRLDLVVLPLESTDSARSAWADGLTEQLMEALASVPELDVTVRSAAFALRGAEPAEAIRRLDANLVLTGMVRRAGDRVTVRLQLTGPDGRVRWTQPYDLSVEEAVRIGSWQRIASDVRAQLGADRPVAARVAGGASRAREDTAIPDRGGRTTDTLAFELYSKGRAAWFSRSPNGFAAALQYFEAALARDSTYARALVGRAQVYNLMGGYDYGLLPPDVAFSQARVAAERALALAPDDHEAWAALAHVRFVYDRDWEAADSAFRTALELNPRYAQGRHRYSLFLVAMGRKAEALEQARLAHELDSQSPVYIAAMARQHYFLRQYSEAEEYYREAVALDPGFFHPRLGLGLTLLAQDRPREAEGELRRALDLVGGSAPLPLTFLYAARAQAGDTAAASEGLSHLARLGQQGVYVPHVYEAVLHIARGALDEAVDALEASYRDNSTAMAYLTVHPIAQPLQGHPRYRALVERVGLPDS